jgi:hypothetical protein
MLDWVLGNHVFGRDAMRSDAMARRAAISIAKTTNPLAASPF